MGGKASPTEGVLPGSIYFIVKYGDLFEAAKANAMVGGDSASRAVCIGMVLGSHQGLEGIPQHLKDTFKDWARLDGLLDELPLIKAASSPDGRRKVIARKLIKKAKATDGYAATVAVAVSVTVAVAVAVTVIKKMRK